MLDADKSTEHTLVKFVRMYAPLCDPSDGAVEYLVDSFRSQLEQLSVLIATYVFLVLVFVFVFFAVFFFYYYLFLTMYLYVVLCANP